MPLVNASDLSGQALNLAVGQALKMPVRADQGAVVWDHEPPAWFAGLLEWDNTTLGACPDFRPADDPAMGEALVFHDMIVTFPVGDRWCAISPSTFYEPGVGYTTAPQGGIMGDTAHEAGLRMLVDQRGGSIVDIPEKLLA